MGASSNNVKNDKRHKTLIKNQEENKNKTISNDNLQNNDNLDNYNIYDKNQDLEEIKKIPNDQYTCTECSLVPEILKIDYEFNEIEFKCKTHGVKKLFIKDYFIESSRHSYYNFKCQMCNEFQKDFLLNEENDNLSNIIFNYCYECQNIFCPNCSNKHNHNKNQLFLPVNQLNNKCKTHFEEANFNTYCITCGENVCNINKDTEHQDHFIEIIPKLNPKEEKINMIMNKNNLIKKNIELLEYLYKINNTIITTYRISKCNYYHNINVGHLLDSIKNNFKKTEEGLTNLFNKLNNRQKTQLGKINKKFNLKLTGNENKLNLSHKNLEINDFQLFSGVKFYYLEELSLQNNIINNINILDIFEIPNIRWINLSYNKISDISNLKNISHKIPKLEKINLKSNCIENIDILIDDMFPNIREINIQNNDDIDFETEMAKKIIKKWNDVLVYQLSEEEKQKDLLYLFNQRFENKYSIEEIQINLNGKNMGDDGLRIFSEIHFNQLQDLNLSYNNITSINDFEFVSSPELQILNLSNNEIKDITILSTLNFQYLEKLDLSNNKISDLNIFENVNFPVLEELYLSSNKIKDIAVIGKFKFEKLTKLYLSNNSITNIAIFENLKAIELEELYLNINYIKDIKVLRNVNFSRLQKLYLGQNMIGDISVLEKVNFPKLKKLDLSKNLIKDISVFSKTKFDDLQKLYLSENQISNIKVFGNVSFSQLQELYLNVNEIMDISVFERIKFYQLYGLYLSDNKIDYSFEHNKNIVEKLKILVKNLNI